ncbi:MAG: CbiQ family ECF transporter T component [Fimbriimonas sp.]
MTSLPTSARLHLLGATTLGALLSTGPFLAVAVGAAVGVVWLDRRDVVVALARPTFLVFALLTVLLGAFLFGASVPSMEGAGLGLEIVGRAAAILVVARWVALGATPFEFAYLFGRLGMRWVGFALGIAINALPVLERSTRRTWDAMRMRGGFRRQRWRGLRLLAIATLTNALLQADAQADAATARGFRIDYPGEPGAPWGRRGFLVVVGGWGLAVALVAADLTLG